MADKQPSWGQKLSYIFLGALVVGASGFLVWVLARFGLELADRVASVLGTLIAVCAMAVTARQSRIALRKARSEESVAERADAVRDHLSIATRLLGELEDELSTRTRLLEQRQQDAERYERLASLNEEQAQVIEDLVGRQFERQSRVAWVQWIASVLAAFALGLVVNWISAPVLAWLTGAAQ